MRYSPALAAILALGLILSGLILSVLIRGFSSKMASRAVLARSAVSAVMEETLFGTAEILMAGASEKQLRKIQLASQESQKASLAIASIQSSALGAGLFIANITLVGMLWLGIPLVRSGQMDGITLSVLALITLASFEPINLLPTASAKIETSLASARRLFAVANRPVPVHETLDSPKLMEFESLVIDKLNFSYPGAGSMALKGISFELKPGKKIALVGPSGSGKTTLIRVIQHHLAVPDSSVFWNKIDAVRLSSQTVHNLQAVLAQNGYLFSATLMENLRLANRQISSDVIIDKIKNVGLEEWLNTLPQGLDSWLGDNGSQLSGGERQRLLLARCLMMDRPVILADEPFSNVDLSSESALLKAIFANTANKAVLLATHRLTGMDQFDEILVMDAGQIVQRGRHAILVANPGLYKTLWDQQNGQFIYEP
jgi:ABC-type transport system involved in cytochrome bd biosynthesis fused ATPase/permease subunit